MKSIFRLVVVGSLLLAGTWISETSGRAQAVRGPYYNPYTAYSQALNSRSLANGQLLNNQFTAQFNAFTGAYNPYYYANPYSGYGYGYGGYGYQPYVPQSYAQPLQGPGVPAVDPYSSGYGSGGYPGGVPSSGYNPYNPYGYNPYDPYGYGSFGQTLKGAADLTKAYGNVAIAFEKARQLREEWNQMQLDTKKKKFDLDMYIKANTPTYNEEQARIAKATLKRIQNFSLPGEISTGKALNYLLDDIRKYPNKKLHLEPIMLSEAILNQLNVTKNKYGIGILREGGKFTWPAALHEMLKPEKRADIETRIQNLVKDAHREATNGRIDTNKLKDIRDEMDTIRAQLIDKVHDIPSVPYMEAKRFLQEFYEATVALERGDAMVQTNFQRFIAGGKSVQEVVDYMIANGLRFASATNMDEASYRTIHAALAAYDIAMNTQIAMGGGGVGKE